MTKPILTAITFIAIMICALPQAHASQSHPTTAELKQTLLHSQDLAHQAVLSNIALITQNINLQGQSKELQDTVLQLQVKVTEVTNELVLSKSAVLTLQTQIDGQTALLDSAKSQIIAANKKVDGLKADHDLLVGKYHNAKIWICSFGAIIALFIGIKFCAGGTAMFSGGWSLLIGIGAFPLAVWTALWFLF